ncbi:MAG: PEP-CTERM sorting domain-containing protein [Deltaproteobacteria bacterium]|nr:PEP-CTERM sorting domain-containing protein [Deltaproteobacteria bacterium]
MKRILSSVIAIAALAFFIATTSHAALVGLDPESQTVTVGNPVNVDVFISGLGDSTAPSLGTFDLIIRFDENILSFSDAAFGNQLDIGGLGSLTEVTPATGAVEIFQLSYDSAEDLDTYQAGSFSLAILTFDTLSVGVSPLSIEVISLGNAYGEPLAADLGSGCVSVVPVPGAVWLLGSGLLGLMGVRRRKGLS